MTCVWTPDPVCLTPEWEALEDADKERALILATSSLQMLTYYRVGTCPETIRPCPVSQPCGCWGAGRSAYQPTEGTWMNPLNWNGQWLNCTNCGSRCAPLSEYDIPGPVGYIDSLKIDGAVVPLDDGNWRLDDGHLLVWQGTGPSPLPETQNLNKPDTEVGTWSITYSRSYPVDKTGQLAVAYLAMEFAKACQPKQKCSLPRGVTSVVRNGVSFTLDSSLFPGGLTGLDYVDAYILKWAPAGAPTQTAQVFDPRSVQPRRSTAVPLRTP